MSSIDAKWPETPSSTSKWPAHRTKDWQNSWETSISSRFFEKQANEICRHLSEKASKGSFHVFEKLQNNSNESKELKRKGEKERARKKSGGEKKSNDCTLRFCNSYFVGRKRAI